MVPGRAFYRFSAFQASVVAVAGVLALAHSIGARADGPPLVLSTQTGISDGQKGTVLQNAPLERRPMVKAQKPAAPAELAPDSPPVNIVVEPQLATPGGTPTASSSPSGFQPGVTRSSRQGVARSTSRAGSHTSSHSTSRAAIAQ